jgi:hypothetical protein
MNFPLLASEAGETILSDAFNLVKLRRTRGLVNRHFSQTPLDRTSPFPTTVVSDLLEGPRPKN